MTERTECVSVSEWGVPTDVTICNILQFDIAWYQRGPLMLVLLLLQMFIYV